MQLAAINMNAVIDVYLEELASYPLDETVLEARALIYQEFSHTPAPNAQCTYVVHYTLLN